VKIGSRLFVLILSMLVPVSFFILISLSRNKGDLTEAWMSRELSYGAAFFVTSLLVLLIWQFRCPRCNLKLWETREPNFMRRVCYDRACPRCGRDRDNVWPLQYRMVPEPWDGIKIEKL